MISRIEHDRRRGVEQRAVDAAEDLDRVEAVAGGAGELDLEAVGGGAGAVADRLDGVLERVADAIARLDGLDDQRGLAVGGEDGLLRLQHEREAVLVELVRRLRDPLLVGVGEPGGAFERDDRRREFAAGELLDRLQRLQRLRVTREKRRRLVLLDTLELARLAGEAQVEEDGDDQDDVFATAAGGKRQHHWTVRGAPADWILARVCFGREIA